MDEKKDKPEVHITEGLNADEIDRWIQGNIDSSNQTALIPLSGQAVTLLHDHALKMIETLVSYKELMMMYSCAMKEIQTKFEVLDMEFKVRYRRNPINSISTRLKKTASILEKMARHGCDFSLDALELHVSDIAGVRVVCSYIDDIYMLADALLKQDDITLIAKKDYISSPKENGYRSLHLIVAVPVFFADQKREIKVEVQIRTIAMDFWASLEHQLKYKQAIPNEAAIIADLKACADVISATDEKMLGIRQEIEVIGDKPTEEDILLEKLSRLD